MVNSFLRNDATFAQVDYASVTGTPAIPSPGLVLLATLTASNSATLNDTTSITATYDEYMFVLRNIVPATNNNGLRLRYSNDGGANYQTANYLSNVAGPGAAAAAYRAEGYTDGIALSGANVAFDGIDNTANYGLNGVVYLHAPNAAGSLRHSVTGSTEWAGGDGTHRTNAALVSGKYDAALAAVNAVRFIMLTSGGAGGGNITSGTIKIYGIAT